MITGELRVKEALIIGLALGTALVVTACKKAAEHPETDSSVTTATTAAVAAATSAGSGDTADIVSWKIAHTCGDGSTVYLLSNGHLAVWVAGSPGHWTELVEGASASAACAHG